MKLYPPLMVLAGLIIQGAIAYLAPIEPLLVPLWQYQPAEGLFPILLPDAPSEPTINAGDGTMRAHPPLR